MHTVTTTDIYECCYYLLGGCELKVIEGRIVNGKIACEVTFTGPSINNLQIKYFQNEANVNLFSFRRAYCQMSNYIQTAKKKIKNELKQQENFTQLKGGEL